jgi:hypothetical protein
MNRRSATVWLPHNLLCAVAAGGALYLTVSGVSFTEAFEMHPAPFLFWIAIELGALLIFGSGSRNPGFIRMTAPLC